MVGPVITPGCAGAVFRLTANVAAVLLPQAFVATTEIVPLVVPAVTLIELEVEVPFQPEGKVQV